MRPRALTLTYVAGALVVVTPGRASAQALERIALHADGGSAFLTGGARTGDVAGVGFSANASLGVRLIGALEVQAAFGASGLPLHDQRFGALYTVGGGLRFEPRIAPRPWGGPVLEADVGAGFTGTDTRFAFGGGVGWFFAPADFVGIGPIGRYAATVSPPSATGGTGPLDVQVFSIGLGLTLRIPSPSANVTADARASALVPPPPREIDSDNDGVPDSRDRCVHQPEDVDGFQDDDGCPDPDNDEDGIVDARDRCRDAAETRNGFEDDDGCPDSPPCTQTTVPEVVTVSPATVPVVTAPVSPVVAPVATRPRENVNNASASARTAMDLPLPRQEGAVFFDTTSFRVMASQQPAIDATCAAVRGAGVAQRVRVVGRAYDEGAADVQEELAGWRAAEVARALARCGIAATRVDTVSQTAPDGTCASADAVCVQRQRRVDLSLSLVH